MRTFIALLLMVATTAVGGAQDAGDMHRPQGSQACLRERGLLLDLIENYQSQLTVMTGKRAARDPTLERAVQLECRQALPQLKAVRDSLKAEVAAQKALRTSNADQESTQK